LLLIGVAMACAFGQQSEKPEKTDDAPRVERYPFITDAEAHILVDWYRPGSGHKVKLPDLPNGWYKTLHRAATLAPATEKKCEALPADLERRLLETGKEYRRVICGQLVLLVKSDTGLIVDHIDIARQ